jgi:hypothetical protein
MILIQNTKSISFKNLYRTLALRCFEIEKEHVYFECSSCMGNTFENKQYNVKLSDYIVFIYAYRSPSNEKKYKINPGGLVSKEEFYEKLLARCGDHN